MFFTYNKITKGLLADSRIWGVLRSCHTILMAVLLFSSVLVLLPDRFFSENPSASSLSPEDKILRLHILAADNDTASQEIKLHVRDAVLTLVRSAVQDAKTANEAELALSLNLDEITETANRVLRQSGVPYRAHAAITTEFFPIKQYGSLLLPPGQYRALRIILGEGKGENWWCMLYPSLCFTEGITATITDEKKEELREHLTKDEYRLLFSEENTKPKFCFRLPRLLKKIKRWLF